MAEETARIEIQPDGPYRVIGGVPLKEMAPVHTFNGEPIAWHELREIKTPGDEYELCRCGQSQNKPFCDSSHETCGFDGAETADPRPYREQARSWQHGDETLYDNLPLCIHAGFCRTKTRDTWKDFAQSEDPAIRDQIREMVGNCPSGRLALSGSDGFPLEAGLPQEVAVLPGGPLWVRGGLPLIGSDGRLWEPRNRMTLCRCGQSKNKPFCDDSHSELDFDPR